MRKLTLQLYCSILLLAILVGMPFSLLSAKTLRCFECSKSIRGQYVTSQGRNFCSQRCFKRYSIKQLPKCVICGNPCRKYFKSEGKYYCSKKCISTTWPECSSCGKHMPKGVVIGGETGRFFCEVCAARPRCFACNFPAKCDTLDDGRKICPECSKTAIFGITKAMAIFRKVRRRMRKELGIGTRHKVDIRLVNIKTLQKDATNDTHGLELGLYIYQATIVERTTTKDSILGRKKTTVKKRVQDESRSILLLYGMPRHKMIEVIAHELAHDWMQEFYPNISDLKIKEGWAEYIASLVNTLYKQDHMNKRMHSNTDPVYGDGFRMIHNIASENGMDGLKKFFESKNQ